MPEIAQHTSANRSNTMRVQDQPCGALAALGRRLACISTAVNSKLFVFSAVALGVMAIPTFFDVLSRIALSRSLLGTVEIVEFLMVVTVFASFGFLQDKRAHIRVDLVIERLPLPVKDLFEVFINGTGMVMFAAMTWCMWHGAMERAANNETSMMLGIPVWGFAIFAMFGIGCLCFSCLASFIQSTADAINRRNLLSVAAAVVILSVVIYSPFILRGMEWTQNYMLLGGLGMLILLALLILGMPIGLGMSAIGYLGLLVLYPEMSSANSMLGLAPYTTGSSYVFTVVPMFILMGELAMYSGISGDLFNAANVWLGRLPGGLAVATVSGCAGFAAVSGDSMATAVTMASVALPEMKKKNYDQGFSCATLAAGGTLGILIPPSTGFIFYSLVTEVSIGRLFLAGIIPGLMLAAVFIGVVLIFSWRNPQLAPRGEKTTMSEKMNSVMGVIPMVLLIILILGGILSGAFSPNEGGAVGAVATFIYAVCRGRFNVRQLWAALRSAAQITSGLLLILISVGLLSFFFAATSLPFELADLIVGLNANRYVILLVIVVFYLILGMLMNVLPMVLLTLPAIFPSIISLGFDPVWFGVVVVVLMEAGQITPPVGINVFAISSVARGVPMTRIFRYIVPYFIGMMLLVLLLTLFPALATWLPNLMM